MTPREAALKEKLTPEFLETLAEAIRVVGWGVDMHESQDLAKDLFELAGTPCPALEPYEDE